MIEKNCGCKKCIRHETFGWFNLNRKDRLDLIGQYYDCICNPMTGGYSYPIQHHYHKVKDAVEIYAPDHIFNGLALLLDVGDNTGRSVYGCKQEHISQNLAD